MTFRLNMSYTIEGADNEWLPIVVTLAEDEGEAAIAIDDGAGVWLNMSIGQAEDLRGVLFELIEHAKEEAGISEVPCGVNRPEFLGMAFLYPCVLPANHEGYHEDRDGDHFQ